jgi:hypothetical protein
MHSPSESDIDFINHPDLGIRDLSYSASRTRQLVDLAKGSFFDMGFGPQPDDAANHDGDDEDWPKDRLEIYIKEKPRGPGYVCDIVYHSDNLPVIVYAVLINRGLGLEIAELELFRRNWGCFDDHDNYLHPDQQDPIAPNDPPTLITSDTLRRIPRETSSPESNGTSPMTHGARKPSNRCLATPDLCPQTSPRNNAAHWKTPPASPVAAAAGPN